MIIFDEMKFPRYFIDDGKLVDENGAVLHGVVEETGFGDNCRLVKVEVQYGMVATVEGWLLDGDGHKYSDLRGRPFTNPTIIGTHLYVDAFSTGRVDVFDQSMNHVKKFFDLLRFPEKDVPAANFVCLDRAEHLGFEYWIADDLSMIGNRFFARTAVLLGREETYIETLEYENDYFDGDGKPVVAPSLYSLFKPNGELVCGPFEYNKFAYVVRLMGLKHLPNTWN